MMNFPRFKKVNRGLCIIQSLLDLDFYKLTTGQLVFKKYSNVSVKFAFKCRTNVRLADFIRERDLRHQLDYVREIRILNEELDYLRSIKKSNGERRFSEDYILFLKNLQLPEYDLKVVDGNFVLEFFGLWSEVTYWETISLSIINELYYLAMLRRAESSDANAITYRRGENFLKGKVQTLLAYPEIIFTEFGTRRRFSREWQEYVVATLAKLLPRSQFVGTSNVHLAMKYGLVPIGTMPHEPFMIMGGIMREKDEEKMVSHNQILKDWWEEYGYDLSVALTDTYGTDFFLRDMTVNQAKDWKGLRHDSNDPIAWGEKVIAFYKSLGIAPMNKFGFFSDGLDLDKMIAISSHFDGRLPCRYGWGTNLTNDMGMDPLSLVVKPVMANGYGLVKLSDNLSKATGELKDIERIKRLTGYTGIFREECRY